MGLWSNLRTTILSLHPRGMPGPCLTMLLLMTAMITTPSPRDNLVTPCDNLVTLLRWQRSVHVRSMSSFYPASYSERAASRTRQWATPRTLKPSHLSDSSNETHRIMTCCKSVHSLSKAPSSSPVSCVAPARIGRGYLHPRQHPIPTSSAYLFWYTSIIRASFPNIHHRSRYLLTGLCFPFLYTYSCRLSSSAGYTGVIP